MRDADMPASVLVITEENGGATDHVENGSSKLSGRISYRSLIPHLVVQAPAAVEAIAFYKNAFGAEEVAKTFYTKRKAEQEHPLIQHAHLKFGDANIFIVDETEDAGPEVQSPASLNGTTTILHLETNNVDAAFKRAVEAGGTITEIVSDRAWGQRYGKILDPYGFAWSIASPLKEKIAMAEETLEAGHAA